MIIQNILLEKLKKFRRELHQFPEVSGQEEETSRRVISFLKDYQPTKIESNLGGYGVAAVFDSGLPGPSVMIRCELDALPIREISDISYRSLNQGVGHLCGHDGHMTMVGGLAEILSKKKPQKGKAILLFQPAEEIGTGANAVCNELIQRELIPDYSYSLHNMPGLPLGHVAVKNGVFNCASIGVSIEFDGKTAHASNPEQGISPVPAITSLAGQIEQKNQELTSKPTYQHITVVHLNIGEPAFGIAPGNGRLFATLRCETDEELTELKNWIITEAESQGTKHHLSMKIDWCDHFPACENHKDAVEVVKKAFSESGAKQSEMTEPMRPSEDFGRYSQFGPSAMFLLGSGENQPGLHNPDYDFPDSITPVGLDIFTRILDHHLDLAAS